MFRYSVVQDLVDLGLLELLPLGNWKTYFFIYVVLGTQDFMVRNLLVSHVFSKTTALNAFFFFKFMIFVIKSTLHSPVCFVFFLKLSRAQNHTATV